MSDVWLSYCDLRGIALSPPVGQTELGTVAYRRFSGRYAPPEARTQSAGGLGLGAGQFVSPWGLEGRPAA